MAELTTIARPYAKAAFDIAAETKSLSDWSKMLGLAAWVSQQEKIIPLLSSPELTDEQLAEHLNQILSEEQDVNRANFISYLAKNKRLPLLPEISVLFESYKAEYEKSVDVEISTAFDLNEQIQSKLAEALSKKLQRSINITYSVDKELIGGAVIKAGDLVIDGSVQGKLEKLANSMAL